MRRQDEARAEKRKNKRVRKTAEKLFGELTGEIDDPLAQQSTKISVEQALEQGLRAIAQKLNAASVSTGNIGSSGGSELAPVIGCATDEHPNCMRDASAFARSGDQIVAVCPSLSGPQAISQDEFSTPQPSSTSIDGVDRPPDPNALADWTAKKEAHDKKQEGLAKHRSAVIRAATLVHEFAHLVYGGDGLDIYSHDAAFSYLGQEPGLRDEAIVNPDSITAFVLHAAVGGRDVSATEEDAKSFMSGTMMSLETRPTRTEPKIGMLGARKEAVARSIAFAQSWLKVGLDSSRFIQAAFQSLDMEPYSTWGDRVCDVYDDQSGRWNRDKMSPVCRQWPPIRDLDDVNNPYFDQDDSPDVIERKREFWERMNARNMETSAPGCPPPRMVADQEKARNAILARGASDCGAAQRNQPRDLRPFVYPQEPRWLIAAMRGDDFMQNKPSASPRVPGFSCPLDEVPVGDTGAQQQVAQSLADLYAKAIGLLNQVDVPGLARIFSLPKPDEVANPKLVNDTLTVNLRAKSFMDLSPRERIETFVDVAVDAAMESQRAAAMDSSASEETKALIESIEGTEARAIISALPKLPA